MMISGRFYRNILPSKNDVVAVKVTQKTRDGFYVSLYEYFSANVAPPESPI